MADPSEPRHRLIGTEVSLYTGKARAYLRFKGIPFDEVLSRREVYRDIILPRTGVRFIPVLVTDDDRAIQDTTDIIDALEQRYPEPAIYPAGPLQRLVALLLEVYGDEWLVIPAMHYRWNLPENRAFAMGEFGRTNSPDLSPEQQRELGEQLAGPFAGALPYLGITEATAPAIERSYLGLLAELEAHFSQHAFLLGDRPSIGDFGLIGPLYAHLYRDPASGRLMEQVAPRVADWVQRMQHPRGDAGAFLPDDQVPASLLPLLQRMFREQVPTLIDTADRLAAWAAAAEDPSLPRGIGTHPFTVEGVTGERTVRPYDIWMWQRPVDHFQGLDPAARARAESLFEAVPGAIDALARAIPQRVHRRDNRVVLAP